MNEQRVERMLRELEGNLSPATPPPKPQGPPEASWLLWTLVLVALTAAAVV